MQREVETRWRDAAAIARQCRIRYLCMIGIQQEIAMKRLCALGMWLVIAFTFAGCAHQRDAGWITLLDGTSLDNWNRVGDANWRLVDGVVQADKGEGYLVTKDSYRDVQIRAEFWVDDDANSGILMRMTDRQEITPMNSYEVNIFDKRPDPSYGTGAIVLFAKVSPMPKAGGRWNTFEITAKGPHLRVVLNGIETANIRDTKFASGPFCLQYAGGVVKFRKVQVRPL
jgi:hypothetical protein